MSEVPGGSKPRILIVGCGGIGGIVAACLLEQGHDVTVITRNAHIADAINSNGFRTRGDVAPGTVQGNVVTELPRKTTTPFDFIMLATQPPQVEDAATGALPHLAHDGAMVCFQNGLCELRIAEIVGSERVLGAIVAWGASMLEPGVYDRTSAGGFTIGGIGQVADAQLSTLSWILEAVGPVTITDNLMGARWSKLAINCAISSLGTVGGDRLGPLIRKRFVRRFALEVMSETVAVAQAEGVALQKVSGTIDLDWMALTAAERDATLGSPSLFAKHTLLLAVGARYRRLRSSMLRAIERGREPAVDFLNGEVVARAEAHGVATPFNTALRDEVKRIAAGKLAPGVETLRALFDRTRATSGETGSPPRVADDDSVSVPPVSGEHARVPTPDEDDDGPHSSVRPSDESAPPPISSNFPIPPGPDSR